MKAKRVRLIESRPVLQPNNKITKDGRRRVAAYARVSTDSEEQLTSYETQVSYYTKFIQSNPEWSFVEVYTDEGISGLMTKKREGFQTMVQDALAGQIDLILTKSVSRFARNTVDTLMTVRQLKEKGVEVYFEKENIYTLDSKGELLITIMSSLAQEESRSISENVTWGQRKRFADGKVNLPYKSFLGYQKGTDGRPTVVAAEAKIVQRIYQAYLGGGSYSSIASELTKDGVKTPKDKAVWSRSTVQSILTNEKYKGDALLQKRFTVDFLTKKQKINEGEVPQYYVTNSHEAIISEEVFEMVQREIERRRMKKHQGSSINFFSGQIVCGCCGEAFTRKVWHSTSKYKRYIWQCGKKYTRPVACSTTHLTEEAIQSAFMKLVWQLLASRETVLSTCRHVLMQVLYTSSARAAAEQQEESLQANYDELHAHLMASTQQVDDTVAERQAYQAAIKDYETKQNELEQLKADIVAKEQRAFACERFMTSLSQIEGSVESFSEVLWLSLVDHVYVPAGGEKRLIFHLRNGDTITQPVE